MTEEWNYIPIRNIKAVEQVFPNHLDILKQKIVNDGYIRDSIIIDKDTHIILDGSHRHIVLCELGCKYAPVRMVEYESPDIRLGTNLIHRFLVDKPIEITKNEVISRGLSGDLLPPRTTRHFFPFNKHDNINVSLDRLGRLELGEQSHVDSNIANVLIKDEIKCNKNYLKEIDQEMIVINRYIEEMLQTKQYLTDMVEEMEQRQEDERKSWEK